MIHPPCSKCGRDAVLFIRYNGTHLCQDHFHAYFQKRVKKEIRKQGSLPQGRIAVALSGGKDSLVATMILHHLISQHTHHELHAITIDEGIQGYRPATIDIAKDYCASLEIPHHLVSFKEMVGYTMDEITQKGNLGACTYCGVFRRYCLNKTARDLDAQVLTMGHNLDDMSQSILMNFVNNDLERLARIGPHKKIQPGLIPRLMPLRSIPEKEITLFAVLNHLNIYEHECPYAPQAARGTFRDIIQNLEAAHPGTRHSILNSYEALEHFLAHRFPPIRLQNCKTCGEPASQDTCRVCILLSTLKSPPLK